MYSCCEVAKMWGVLDIGREVIGGMEQTSLV